MKVTWTLLKQVVDTRNDGHYSTFRTVRGRGGRRVAAWVSEAVKAPRLKALADFVNADPWFQARKYEARVTATSQYKGRQGSNGIYYSRGEYHGNEFTLLKRGEVVFRHNAVDTYRSNDEVCDKLLDVKAGREVY